MSSLELGLIGFAVFAGVVAPRHPGQAPPRPEAPANGRLEASTSMWPTTERRRRELADGEDRGRGGGRPLAPTFVSASRGSAPRVDRPAGPAPATTPSLPIPSSFGVIDRSPVGPLPTFDQDTARRQRPPVRRRAPTTGSAGQRRRPGGSGSTHPVGPEAPGSATVGGRTGCRVVAAAADPPPARGTPPRSPVRPAQWIASWPSRSSAPPDRTGVRVPHPHGQSRRPAPPDPGGTRRGQRCRQRAPCWRIGPYQRRHRVRPRRWPCGVIHLLQDFGQPIEPRRGPDGYRSHPVPPGDGQAVGQ